MKILHLTKELHGKKVKCTIRGIKIDDAKIYVMEAPRARESHLHYLYYLCQNKVDGAAIPDTLGYRYSWNFSKARDNEDYDFTDNVCNLELIQEDWNS